MKNKNYTIIREEEYKRLSRLTLDGTILDVGGSVYSGYQEIIGGDHTITTANIDPESGCDLVFNIEKEFPIESNSYDNVISLNVFEHVFNFKNVFKESRRVLKSGGIFICSTPFMFHIHGSPDDYFRYTKSALIKILRENGFKEIKIEELGFGVFSFIFQTIELGIPFTPLKYVLKRGSVFLDTILLFFKKYRQLRERIPLGYFIVARK